MNSHRASPGQAFTPLWSRIGALCPCCPRQQGQAGRLSVLGPTPSSARCLISSHSTAADPELHKHHKKALRPAGGSLSWEASGPGLPWAQRQVTRTLAQNARCLGIGTSFSTNQAAHPAGFPRRRSQAPHVHWAALSLECSPPVTVGGPLFAETLRMGGHQGSGLKSLPSIVTLGKEACPCD